MKRPRLVNRPALIVYLAGLGFGLLAMALFGHS